MKDSTWEKTSDDPSIEPTIRWEAEIGDTITVRNMADGWAVSLDFKQGAAERTELFGEKRYPSQARDDLERHLKANGFTLVLAWGGFTKG